MSYSELRLTALTNQLTSALATLSANPSRLAFATSLGMEDMVLTDCIARHHFPVDIFTLDTGRLPAETYELLATIEKHYPDLNIRVIFPQTKDVQELVHSQGINGFYDSAAARKACCAVRKIEPLKRALSNASAWITGLRKEQSEARSELTYSAIDGLTQLVKTNPLLEWTADDVEAYLRINHVPINALHARGYPSIGCAPCTRAVAPGEHPRAGRWWWEQGQDGQAAQECGLHVDASGRLVRNNKQEIAAP
jgi:phosphoadenosine phosphosulfate reductase